MFVVVKRQSLKRSWQKKKKKTNRVNCDKIQNTLFIKGIRT